MASRGLRLGGSRHRCGARAGTRQGGWRWRSLPESARRDPSAARRGSRLVSAVQRWARRARAPRRRLGSSGGLRAAIVGRTGGRRRRSRPAAARRPRRCGRQRVVVRGRPGRLGRPARGRVAAVRRRRKMFPQKVVAVGHGVNPDCVCIGLLRCISWSASDHRVHCGPFAWVSGAASAGAARVSCCVIASARLSAGPGANTRISGHGACRAMRRRDAQRPQGLVVERDAVPHALVADPPHGFAAGGVRRRTGGHHQVGRPRRHVYLVGLDACRASRSFLTRRSSRLSDADRDRQALARQHRGFGGAVGRPLRPVQAGDRVGRGVHQVAAGWSGNSRPEECPRRERWPAGPAPPPRGARRRRSWTSATATRRTARSAAPRCAAAHRSCRRRSAGRAPTAPSRPRAPGATSNCDGRAGPGIAGRVQRFGRRQRVEQRASRASPAAGRRSRLRAPARPPCWTGRSRTAARPR